MRPVRSPCVAGAVLMASVLAGACATVGETSPRDPFEDFNRESFAFNGFMDRTVVAPLANLYTFVVPRGGRRGVANFFANLGNPGVILNDFLQGKFEQGLEDTGRFIFNSTLGLGGVIDIAGPLGLPSHEEDFGQTLAVWGVNSGPYLEVPLFGPYTLRGATDLPIGAATNPFFYLEDPPLLPTLFLGVLDERAGLSQAIRTRDEALDPYVFQREAFIQHRVHLIHDGQSPAAELDDLDALDPLSEESSD
ncbi:MAG: MlaA family lipoprotein [Gammaproteobacteria bacterium]